MTNLHRTDISGLILTGGKSSRMGTNKALLLLGKINAITRIVEIAKTNCAQIVLATNEPEKYQFLALPCVKDVYKGKGPLGGLHSGLSAIETDWVLVFPCDLPLISVEYIQPLLEAEVKYDIVIYESAGRLHPLFGRYNRRILPRITDCLEAERLKIQEFFHPLQVKILQAESYHFSVSPEICFMNMNTQADYENVKSILENHEV